MKDIDWNLVGFVKRSENRIRALELLKSPFMPSELGEEMKVSLTHASKIIRELYAKKLVECLNEELKVGRLYVISKKGKKVMNIIVKKR